MKWIKRNDRFEFVSDTFDQEAVIFSSLEEYERLEHLRITNYFDCPVCQLPHVCKNRTTVCADCLGKQVYRVLKGKPAVAYKKYREPVAFMTHQATGKQVAVDNKGRKFDVSETRYDLDKDKHGWKSTGRKVAKYDINGNQIT